MVCACAPVRGVLYRLHRADVREMNCGVKCVDVRFLCMCWALPPPLQLEFFGWPTPEPPPCTAQLAGPKEQERQERVTGQCRLSAWRFCATLGEEPAAHPEVFSHSQPAAGKLSLQRSESVRKVLGRERSDRKDVSARAAPASGCRALWRRSRLQWTVGGGGCVAGGNGPEAASACGLVWMDFLYMGVSSSQEQDQGSCPGPARGLGSSSKDRPALG